MHSRVVAAFFILGLFSNSEISGAEPGVGTLVMPETFRLGSMESMPRNPAPHLATEQIDYAEFNAAEWQVILQSAPGDGATRIDDIKSADFETQFPATDALTLHWNRGSHAQPTDFQPMTEALTVGQPLMLESLGGRSSDGVMPYFNLATDDGGLIIAVGWPGDWRVTFQRTGSAGVRITAGLKHNQLLLGSGEKLRLPSILIMGYRGDWLTGQNQFRRLMLRHFTPNNHPPMELMPVAASVHGMIGFNDTTEESLTALAAEMDALALPLDTVWLDAGWNKGGFPGAQGNPMSDPVRFPHGLDPVGKAVARSGRRFLVWFEPERAMRGTWLDVEHPSWLLKPSNTTDELRYLENDGFRLLDLGNIDARRWAIQSVSEQITSAGISIYRQDFNESPEYFWHTDVTAEEAASREVRYVNGLYEFLDELARRHPRLILDNCASGGRRMDFEMMRRCVVLWRSDSCWDDSTYPRNVQAMTYGLSLWIPLHGLGAAAANETALRSGMGACASFAINYHDSDAVSALRRHLDRYLKIRPLFAADFYPLTAWSTDSKKWLAFQWHDPAKGEGLVQAFCSADTASPVTGVQLHGLERGKRYVITDWDNESHPTEMSGEELMTLGLELRPDQHRQSVVLHYTRVLTP